MAETQAGASIESMRENYMEICTERCLIRRFEEPEPRVAMRLPLL